MMNSDNLGARSAETELLIERYELWKVSWEKWAF
jgi:hypothetical protein